MRRVETLLPYFMRQPCDYVLKCLQKLHSTAFCILQCFKFISLSLFFFINSLPLPWLLYAVINSFSPVTVSSNGLFCAIVLLFIMLLFVILSIAFCKWKMNKILGFLMFGLYFVFLIVSVLLEDKVIQCPVSI